MRDIETREDLEEILFSFYSKALADNVIGHIFTDIAKLDLAEHLPVITDFWEMLLFGNGNFQKKYGRSPMQKHVELNEKIRLEKLHFERWLKLFSETIDENFQGFYAGLAKQRAVSIAQTMILKFTRETFPGVRVVRE